jgi:hypothetical protein
VQETTKGTLSFPKSLLQPSCAQLRSSVSEAPAKTEFQDFQTEFFSLPSSAFAGTSILNLFRLLQALAMTKRSFAEVRAQAELGHEEIGSQNLDYARQTDLDRPQGHYAQLK